MPPFVGKVADKVNKRIARTSRQHDRHLIDVNQLPIFANVEQVS